jgi:cytochrome c biogenesis protein CcdA
MQNYMLKALGPILILIGMFLIDLLELNFLSFSISEKTGKKYADKGNWGTFILGILFALSFCPVSAALFFGGMIPIAVKFKSSIILPFFYGLGTAAPVVLFAFLITTGMKAVDKALRKIGKIEKVMKYATGYLFILIGIYLALIHIFKMDF